LKASASRYVIAGKTFAWLPESPIRTFTPRLRILNEFDPIEEKELVSEPCIASMEVNTPISAIIPMAIISAVRQVRNLLLTMDCKASFTFSRYDIVTDMARYFIQSKRNNLKKPISIKHSELAGRKPKDYAAN